MEKDKYAFLDTLDEEQAKNAELVIDGAIKRGLNPRLAVAMAFRESGLRHADGDKVKIGADGEIGLMQIKIPTGKMQGYKPEQLNTVQGNVDAGLDYLKSGFDRYRDPVLAAAGYNTGYDHPYFSDPDKNELPKSTENYLKAIRDYGGFDEPEQSSGEASQTKKTTQASEDDFRTAKAAAMGALAGGTLGGLADKVFGGRTPAAPPGVPGMAPGAPGAPPPGAPPPGGLPTRVEPSMASGPSAQATRILQGGQGDTLGTTGRARQEGYNIETAQRAANKGEASKLSPQARQVLANVPGLTSTESGVLYPRTEPRQTAGPRAQPSALRVRGGVPYTPLAPDIGGVRPGPNPAFGGQVEPTMGTPRPPAPPSSALPGPSAGQQFMQGAKGVVGALGRSPMLAGAVSGAGALGGAQETKTRYDLGDMLGAAVAGIGALGGLAAAVPHPMTRIVGGGLAMASPAALMLIDQMRQRSANQQPRP
jgi:hypothetical protein